MVLVHVVELLFELWVGLVGFVIVGIRIKEETREEVRGEKTSSILDLLASVLQFFQLFKI